MATIVPITGAVGSTLAAATLALASYTSTTGRHNFVSVHIDDVTKTVTTITDSRGNTYTQVGAINGTGIRVEMWKCSTGSTGANVVTINLSGNANYSGAVEEYSGVVSFGSTSTDSGVSEKLITGELGAQDSNNYIVGALGFACLSGDTLTAIDGTSRRSIIPAATSAGGAIYDTTDTIAAFKFFLGTRISTARNWASFLYELRTQNAATNAVMPEMSADNPHMEMMYTSEFLFFTDDIQFPERDAIVPILEGGVVIY